MPRIETHHCDGFSVNVNYSLKSEAFTINLPAELKIYGESLTEGSAKEVKKAFDALVRKYKREDAKRERIIIVHTLRTNSRVEDNFVRAGGKREDMELAYAVVDKVQVGSIVKFYEVGPYQKSPFSGDEIPAREVYFGGGRTDYANIPWTKGREEQLSAIMKTMTELKGRMRKFFTSDQCAIMLDGRASLISLPAPSEALE
jgi:hypothetical protein